MTRDVLVEKRVQGAGNSNCAALSYAGALQAELRYDPTGRLYEVSGGTLGTQRFAYDGNAMIAEYNASGTMLRRYVHGSNVDADDPLIVYEGAVVSDAARRYLHADPRGSIVAVTNNQGTSIATNSYDEYGIPDSASGTDIATKGRFRYTGQAWLPELGMYYYKARIYSPTLGRFLQTDPIGYEDQFNLYAYVQNDPVNGIDPSGLDTTECDAGGEGECETKESPENEIILHAPGGTQSSSSNQSAGIGAVGRGFTSTPPQKDSVLDSVVKCGADQLGISNLIEADLVRRGLPEAGSKRFVTEGSSPGTSQLSRSLSERFPQKIPGGRIWTPDLSFAYTFEPSDLRRLGRMSSTVGRAAGRLIPVVSAGLLIYDLAATGICVVNEQSGD